MDEIDKKIVAQLQTDGRTTLQDLAKITGFTSMGTKKKSRKTRKKTPSK
jgi:DNA-binding Lrp family transcriptional regulator